MEKRINQDNRIRWRVLWIATGTLAGPLLILAVVATIVRKLPVVDLVPVLLVACALPTGFALLQKFGREKNRFRNEWILRNEGLERIYSSGGREIILWGQIKRMSWTPVAGLIFMYAGMPEMGEQPSRALRRGNILIEKPDATEIAEAWRQQCPPDETERARRTTRRRQIGMSLMCVGVVVACVISPLVYEAYQTYQWPSVDGKVVSAQYELNHSSKYPMGDVQIAYEYAVGAAKYQSDRFRPLSKGYRDEVDKAQAFVNEHRKGMPVRVFYDPKQPADAVLLQGPEWGLWGPMLAEGPLFVILGWLIRRKDLRLEF